MQDLRREGCGAILTERCNSLVDLRARGTVTGNPYIVAGPRGGRATLFSGAAQYVTLPAYEERVRFNSASADFSISGWVKSNNDAEIQFIFDKRDAGNDGWAVFKTADHKIKAQFNAVTVTSDAVLIAGVWTHFTATYDRDGNLTVYVAGAASGTPAALGSAAMATTTAPRIAAGSYFVGSNEFNGAVADLTVWPRVLTAAEVLQEYNGSTWDYNLAMTHRWDLSSLASPDHVGTVNMVDTGLVASTDIVASPYGGYATQYNGTDEKSTAGDVGTVRSVSFMVRPDSTGAVTEEIILLSTGNDIMVSGGTITYAGVTASATYVDGVETTALVAGKWQHVVCVLSADHAATAFAVGTDGTNFGAISIDDVRTYSTALTNLVAADMARRATGGH